MKIGKISTGLEASSENFNEDPHWGVVHKCGELGQHETHNCVHVYLHVYAFSKNKDLYASNTLLYIIE